MQCYYAWERRQRFQAFCIIFAVSRHYSKQKFNIILDFSNENEWFKYYFLVLYIFVNSKQLFTFV